jgi:hypothetical protein
MEQRDYLKQHLREVLRVIDSCLEAIYAGGTHMYRPLGRPVADSALRHPAQRGQFSSGSYISKIGSKRSGVDFVV